MTDDLRAAALAATVKCHRCAFLRQEHRNDMGHKPDHRMLADAAAVLALLDANERQAARIAELEAALGGVLDAMKSPTVMVVEDPGFYYQIPRHMTETARAALTAPGTGEAE